MMKTPTSIGSSSLNKREVLEPVFEFIPIEDLNSTVSSQSQHPNPSPPTVPTPLPAPAMPTQAANASPLPDWAMATPTASTVSSQSQHPNLSPPTVSIPLPAPAMPTQAANASPLPARAMVTPAVSTVSSQSQHPNPSPPTVSTPLPAPAMLTEAANASRLPAWAMAAAAASSSSNRIPEHLMCKNRLQEHTQKASLPLPVYQTINEGSQHAPRFRSTVLVNGKQFTSPNTFLHRKEAEQDIARFALQYSLKKMKEEGPPLIQEDTVFCKSILNEYAVKMQLEKPTYNTVHPQGLLPTFVSSLVFNGVTYTGETGRNKKEAEQLAARVVILSLMDNSESETIISEIIKSKAKFYAALHKGKDSHNANNGTVPVQSKNVPTGAIPQAAPSMHPPHHEFTIPKAGPVREGVKLPIAFVHPGVGQSVDAGPSSGKKRRKNKKKANKKIRTASQLAVAVMPVNEASPCLS